MSTDDRRQDDLDYLLSLRPPSAYDKWCVGKTDEEIEASHQRLVRELHLKSLILRGASTHRLERLWNVPYDEQRDLGYDDQRDVFNDGPGDYGWSWHDEDPQPVQD